MKLIENMAILAMKEFKHLPRLYSQANTPVHFSERSRQAIQKTVNAFTQKMDLEEAAKIVKVPHMTEDNYRRLK